MSDFHQQAIEDVARAMGRSPGRLGYAIKNGGLGVKAKELAYAVAQRERVLELEADYRKLAIAAHRLTSGEVYPKWAASGGGDECQHGINKAIPCAKCDVLTVREATEKAGLIQLAASAPEKAKP